MKKETTSIEDQIERGFMIKIGIIGVGNMGENHIERYQEITGCQVVAVTDLNPEQAQKVADKYSIPTVYADAESLLNQREIDAVSIVTPDATHCSVALHAIEQGKHVLCEKPLAENYEDALRMWQAAQDKGVIHMVNLSYRDASAIQKASEIVESGRLGSIKHVEASYLQSFLSSKVWGDWRTMPVWLWRLSSKHGSKGVLGDVGVHILDFASFAAGEIRSVNCMLKTFHKAEGDQIGEYVLDANDSAVITVEFEGGGIGTIHMSRWATGHTNSLALKVHGDQGAIEIELDQSRNQLQLCEGANVDLACFETLECEATPNNYERFIRSIQTGQQDQPTFERGAQLQKVIDACFISSQEQRTVTL